MKTVQSRIGIMMRSRMRTNRVEVLAALAIESRVWHETTSSFAGDTPMFAVDTVSKLYYTFPKQLCRFADLSEKLMEKFSMIHNDFDDEHAHLEDNDNELVSKFIEIFEPYSGVGAKKSAVKGLKLNVKNNLIIEGKKIAKGFE